MTTFLDTTWKKTNIEFLNSWTTRILDLDLVLAVQTTDAQKRIWLTLALSTHASLKTIVSQFVASEVLSAHSLGNQHKPAPFSLLFEHVKDAAITMDHADLRLQVTNRQANELKGSNNINGRTPRHNSNGGSNRANETNDPNQYVGSDGKVRTFKIPLTSGRP